MRSNSNRSIFLLLGLCLLLLIGVVIYIILLNRPVPEPTPASPSPTPVSADAISPTIPPVEGESELTDDELTQFQLNQRRAAEAYQRRLQRLPFISKLPHTTTHYKVEITAVSDTIYITTYGPSNFQGRYREEALAWIRDNGGNPDAITIQYRN